ncbi:MAG: micrococcal nuclease [Candidatus Omnitrophota bacterium]|jgi:micrococcal nuclease
MKKANAVTSREFGYAQLLKGIRAEMVRSREDIELRKAQAYWAIGNTIATHLLHNKTRAGYNEQLFKRLAKDTSIHERTLQQLIKFSREFPIPNARSQFNWTAYRAFLKVEDHPERLQLMRKARREGLNTRAIEREVVNSRLNEKNKNLKSPRISPLKASPGKLYTYTLDDPETITPQTDYGVVDCGFDIWRQVPCVSSLNKSAIGTFVQSRVDETWFKLKKVEATKSDLYTYAAHCERVVDGDTVIFQIDVGFRTWIRQYLRLRGIDTPELKTTAGAKSKNFLYRLLKKNPDVRIKTHQADIYGRYLTDIFLKDGTYVNQLILDRGYGQRYQK